MEAIGGPIGTHTRTTAYKANFICIRITFVDGQTYGRQESSAGLPGPVLKY